MDGNRRWAKGRGLQAFEGHAAGLEKVKELVVWARDAGVQEVILYAFSTENWNRSDQEVRALMNLFEHAFDTWMEDLIMQEVCIRFIGSRERLAPKLLKHMDALEERTKDAKNGTLAIALSYGGRAEIVAAAQVLAASGTFITENSLCGALWSADLGDPDLVIRTGGDQRLSNFLLWQAAYSELFFTGTLWPDFSKEEFESILAEFSTRERRHGK